MSRLEIALLGKPEVRHDGRTVHFATRKALALLAYLAVEGSAVSREKLSTLFWPDSSSEQGRTTLRTTLVHVREALEEAAEQTPHLWADRDAVQLAQPFELDLNRFQEAVKFQPRGHALAPDLSNSPNRVTSLIADLEQAVALYRGDFLDGFSLTDAPEFDDWSSFLRESWHRKAMLAFDWLSQLQFESGQLIDALATTQRWIALDPLNEMAYQRQMQMFFASNERGAALKTFDQCVRVLAEELGVDPMPETRKLAERIRASSFHGPSSEAGTLPVSPTAVLTPLVGRAGEHNQLVFAYRLARRNQAQVVTIEGEPGIGKTRLVSEFLVWAAAQGAETLQARAFETAGTIAYQPLIELLRSWLSRQSHPEQALDPLWLSELGRLLPELYQRIDGLPAPLPVNQTEAPARLFEAISRWAQVIAGQTPLVLFIDDLQWIDASSLDLLLYASRYWKASAILIIFAVRSDDLLAPLISGLPVTPSLERWLSGLHKEIALTRLSLSALSLEATQQLTEALIGKTSADQLARLSQRLFDETSGQPFFLVQLLKSLLERHEADQSWDVTEVDGSAQADIQALIQSRLARLNAQAVALCSAASVLGDGARFEHLCSVSGLHEDDALSALEGLLQRGLLRESDRRYAFTHDKIREVVYAQIGDARSRILHRRAGDALQDVVGARAELARHALASGQFSRAFELSLTLGDDALRVFAARNAIIFFEQALRLLDATSGESWQAAVAVERRFHLYVQLGSAYELVGDWVSAGSQYQSAAALARNSSHLKELCLALNCLATLAAQFTYDPVAAADYLRQASAVAEASRDLPSIAQTESNMARTSFFYWNLPDARAHGQRALALGRELDQPAQIAGGLSVLSYVGLVTGMPLDDLIALCDEARRCYHTLDNRIMEADCQWVMASAYVHTGQPQACVEAAHAGLTASQAIENDWAFTNNAYNLGLDLLEIGRYGEAQDVVQQGVARARKGHPPTLIFNLIILGAIYRAIQASDLALTAHQEAWSIAARLPQPFVAEWVAAELCADFAQLGQWDAAYEYARQALERRTYQWAYPGFSRWYEVEALLRAGDVDRAASDVLQFAEQLKNFGETRRYRVMLLRSQATLAYRNAHATQAIASLQEALNIAETIGIVGEQWQIKAALAALYQSSGNRAQALLSFDQARQLGQTLAQQITDENLRSRFLDAVRIQTVHNA